MGTGDQETTDHPWGKEPLNDAETASADSLLELLVAFDEGLAVGRAPAALAAPPELAEDFKAAQSVLRLLNETWPQASSPETAADATALYANLPPRAREGQGGAALREPPAGRLGRFEILHELGQGGFGVVYLAYDPTLARRVAVKTPRSDRWREAEFRRRFLQEGRAAALLDHPNIVRVLEAEATESAGYIASAYCEGPSLAAWLRERKQPLPCRQAAELSADLAAGVQHAHERGVIHRDLKPGNILLEFGPETAKSGALPKVTPKICDFGLAKMRDAEQTETRSGVVMGTPQYMAPEQADGRTSDVGPAADVYALGVVLYEMLTGQPPFVGEPGLNLLRQVASAPPERLRRRRKDVPRELETIVLTCLEKEPGRRYASAAALETDLRRWLEGKAPLGRPEAWHRRVGRWVRRHPVWTAAALLLVALVVAGFVAAHYLDPDRQAKIIVAKLDRGESVTLIGATGGPLWSKPLFGSFIVQRPVYDGAYRFFEADEDGLLELVPPGRRDDFRFEAEVHHEDFVAPGPGTAGVFFAYTSAATPRGPEECFCTVPFNDLTAPLKNPADGKPCSCVSVYLYRRLNNVTEKVPVTERFPVGHSEFFEPMCIHGGQKWRQLAVEGTAKEFRIFWEGHLLCTVPTTELSAALSMMRSLPGHEKFDREASHEFAPSGGLGLFLSHSQASFRSVIVSRSPPTSSEGTNP
jgi:serine/threonine-protein kinase